MLLACLAGAARPTVPFISLKTVHCGLMNAGPAQGRRRPAGGVGCQAQRQMNLTPPFGVLEKQQLRRITAQSGGCADYNWQYRMRAMPV
jgi:hypothetical protein